MNISKIFFIGFFLLFFSSNSFALNDYRFIDIDLILKKSTIGKLTLKTLNENRSKALENLKSKEQDIQQQEDDIKKKSNILSKEDLNKQINLLKKNINEFSIYKDKATSNFENQKRELMNIFFKKINPVIEEYVIVNSIKILFNKKDVVLGDTSLDITDEIIEIIDKKFN